MLPGSVTQDIKETCTPRLGFNKINNFNSFLRDSETERVAKRSIAAAVRFGATA